MDVEGNDGTGGGDDDCADISKQAEATSACANVKGNDGAG